MHYFEVPKLCNSFCNKIFCSIRYKTMFGRVSEYFINFWCVKRCKTYVWRLNPLLRGTEAAKMVSQQKHPLYTIRPKTMFGSVSEHFANLRLVKRCKTCVWGVNAVFRGTEAAKMVSQQKHAFYTIRPKMIFGSVPGHFANLRHVKKFKP